MSPTRRLWIGVLIVPPAVGAGLGVVSMMQDCEWGIHDAGLFLVEFALVPLVAGWGVLAGTASLRDRGTWAAALGEFVGGLAGLVWALLAVYGVQVAVAPLGC